MKFPKGIAPLLVPDGYPPPESIESPSNLLSNNNDFTGDWSERSYYWSRFLEIFLLVYLPAFRVSHFSTGFISIPNHLHENLSGVKVIESFAFGAYVLINGLEKKAEIITIPFRENTFPIIIHYGRTELHKAPPHPTGGSSSCWVKSLDPLAAWKIGILSCRHVVAHLTIGSAVSLLPSHSYSGPTSGTLAEMDECTLDASILEIDPKDFPKRVSSISVCNPVAPGLPIELEGYSSTQMGTVLRICHMPSYFGRLYGHRVVVDCCGINGDSGAFIKTTGLPTKGVGIYMGTIPDGSGGREGLGQHLQQVENFFKLEFYL